MIQFLRFWTAHRAVAFALFLGAVLVTCGWVIALPVFPSQDGPLHLYYARIFSELLSHHSGIYSATYKIRSYLPPYSTYYYGLVLFSRFVSLEMADKLVVCLSIALLAFGARELLTAIGARPAWTTLLILPLLLCWPLVMGFLSYTLGVAIACFALAAWCKTVEDARHRHRAWFLALAVATVITHPIPWLIVVAFAGFELAFRALSLRTSTIATNTARWSGWRADAVTCSLACTPAVYVAHFRARTTQDLDVVDPVTSLRIPRPHLGLAQQIHVQWFDLRHLFGLILFDGAGLSHLYRLGLYTMWLGLIAAAVYFQVKPTRTSGTYLSRVWFLFSLIFAVCLLLLPDDLGGGYFFSTRLQMLLYVSTIAAAAVGLEDLKWPAAALGVFATTLACFTVALSFRFITPVARQIATLRAAPSLSTGRPGLAMRAPGLLYPNHLRIYSFYWAPVHYFRWHELLLYNTAWLGDPIIPIVPRTSGAYLLDETFYNESPQFRGRLLPNENGARDILRRVGFLVITRQPGTHEGSPLSEALGETSAGHFADGWTCQQGIDGVWYLCMPHGASASVQ